MKRFKVLVTDYNVPKVALNLLKEKCDLIVNQERPKATKHEIIDKVAGVDAIFWRSKKPLDKDVLNAAGPKLKAVATMSAGIDHIDVNELKSRGIKFANASKALDGAVADIGILLALAAGRRAKEAQCLLKSAQWHPGHHTLVGQDLGGSTVGIVGFGGIGQALAKRLKAFDVVKILYTGPREKPEAKQLEAEYLTLNALIRQSDFLFLTCPLNTETQNLINESSFDAMKKSAILVNVSRGEVVNQEHLIRALKEGTIFAAGLDVMTPEPLPVGHELMDLPNCFVLPHMGTATTRTREEMAKLTALNILKALDGEEMLTPIC